MEEDACRVFPLMATGVMVHQHKGSSLVMYNKNSINAGDGIYVFSMTNKEYCRYLKFVSENEVAVFNLPHTAKLDDAQSEFQLLQIENLQLRGKIFASIRNYK